MKLLIHDIRLQVMTAVLAMCLTLTACNDDPQSHIATGVNESALVVGLITESEKAISSVQLFVFDHATATLVSHSSFTHPGLAASHIQSLSPGTYTVIAAVNANVWVTAESVNNATLSEVTDALKREADLNSQVQSGIIMVEVLTGELTRVTIPLFQGVSTIGTATVRVRFNSVPEVPYDYVPDTHSADIDTMSFRCITELRSPQSMLKAAHIVTAAHAHPEGMYEMEVTVAKGTYDMLIWLESASQPSQFVTDKLDNVMLAQVDDLKPMLPSRGGTATVYQLVVDNDTTITLDAHPATAIYRIIATELDVYREYSESNPERFPPMNQISVALEYIEPYPQSFNVYSSAVNMSDPDYARVHKLDLTDSKDTETLIFQSEMLAYIPGTTVARLTISDATTGKLINSVRNIPINYTPGGITTILVNPLIFTVTLNGIVMDTDWDDIIIHF